VSIVTKIFVVLVTVLSIAVVASMVVYVENTQHFQKELQSTRDALVSAESRANLLEGSYGQLQNKYADAKDALVDTQSQLRQELANRLGEMADLQTRIAQLNQQLSGKDATIDRLTAADQQDNAIIAALRKEQNELQAEAIDARQKAVERAGEVQELRTSLELMNENLRLVKEKLADSKDRIAKLETQLEEAPGARAGEAEFAVRPPDEPIRGLITSVDQLAGGQTLVAINVGSADDVQQGMNFIIHREGQYIATMEVIKVDEQRSAGRVTLKEGTIEPNLQVTTPPRGF
jgi:chromosome segregation ATPase